jgi:hypothetical protein
MRIDESTVVFFVVAVVVMVVVVIVLDYWSILLKAKKSRLFAAVDSKQGELLSVGDALSSRV